MFGVEEAVRRGEGGSDGAGVIGVEGSNVTIGEAVGEEMVGVVRVDGGVTYECDGEIEGEGVKCVGAAGGGRGKEGLEAGDSVGVAVVNVTGMASSPRNGVGFEGGAGACKGARENGEERRAVGFAIEGAGVGRGGKEGA